MPERENAADMLEQIASQYPREVELDGSFIRLRLMDDGDVRAILDFAGTLPPEDIMYLVVNFTEETVVRAWLETIRAGRAITVLALKDERVQG